MGSDSYSIATGSGSGAGGGAGGGIGGGGGIERGQSGDIFSPNPHLSNIQPQVMLDDNLMELTNGRPFPLKHRAKMYFSKVMKRSVLFLSCFTLPYPALPCPVLCPVLSALSYPTMPYHALSPLCHPQLHWKLLSKHTFNTRAFHPITHFPALIVIHLRSNSPSSSLLPFHEFLSLSLFIAFFVVIALFTVITSSSLVPGGQ